MKKSSSDSLYPGRTIATKYVVIDKIGAGWEGEVYRIKEKNTDIERAAKLFYPQRNPRGKVSKQYAIKLHALRNCKLVTQYHAEEYINIKKVRTTVLISELIDGLLLSEFLSSRQGKRLPPFEALHLLHTLCCGLEEIHALHEYHGDLHSGNVIIASYGLHYELKLIDMYHWGRQIAANQREDIIDLITIFYEVLGGQRYYSTQPEVVKQIICGRKRTLILKKFPTVQKLRYFIENLEWD